MIEVGTLELEESLIVFFFSSRRRHTRLQGDWSSDVCSSDLPPLRSAMVCSPKRYSSKLSVYRRRASSSKSSFIEAPVSASRSSSSPIHGGVRSEDTRLNSSHLVISYAVFCLKKKKTYLLYTA